MCECRSVAGIHDFDVLINAETVVEITGETKTCSHHTCSADRNDHTHADLHGMDVGSGAAARYLPNSNIGRSIISIWLLKGKACHVMSLQNEYQRKKRTQCTAWQGCVHVCVSASVHGMDVGTPRPTSHLPTLCIWLESAVPAPSCWDRSAARPAESNLHTHTRDTEGR